MLLHLCGRRLALQFLMSSMQSHGQVFASSCSCAATALHDISLSFGFKHEVSCVLMHEFERRAYHWCYSYTQCADMRQTTRWVTTLCPSRVAPFPWKTCSSSLLVELHAKPLSDNHSDEFGKVFASSSARAANALNDTSLSFAFRHEASCVFTHELFARRGFHPRCSHSPRAGMCQTTLWVSHAMSLAGCSISVED